VQPRVRMSHTSSLSNSVVESQTGSLKYISNGRG
jgi:hypothetical protein